LLGAGNDGHTSSIFPGQEHLLTSSEVYEATYNPNSGQSRIALTGQPIINAEKVIFLIMGKEKADVVSEICMSGDTGPAAYVAHHAREVELFLDQSAAAKLK
jgi:6-phosphogluconolactonase